MAGWQAHDRSIQQTKVWYKWHLLDSMLSRNIVFNICHYLAKKKFVYSNGSFAHAPGQMSAKCGADCTDIDVMWVCGALVTAACWVCSVICYYLKMHFHTCTNHIKPCTSFYSQFSGPYTLQNLKAILSKPFLFCSVLILHSLGCH